MRVLILSHRDVLAALTPRDCAKAMAEVLAAQARGETCLPLRSLMVPPGAAGFMGLMPSWRGGQSGQGGQGGHDGHGNQGIQDGHDDGAAAFAVKALCLMPGNPARGLDMHQGTVTLFDGETGVPTAILDASAVTAVRTAAVTAVATGLLARPGARALAILGAGVQGRAHLRALAGLRDFERISVYAPTQAHASALIEQAIAADSEPGAELSVAPSAADAVRGADVVVTATSAREPVLARSWLKPGAHVNAVGASTPAAREIDTATVAASALFCDSRESLRHEAGEFQLAIAEGAITGEEHVRAELGEVVAGIAPGRRDDGELTLFRSLGIAIEDLAAAQTAVAAARAQGLGTEVDL